MPVKKSSKKNSSVKKQISKKPAIKDIAIREESPVTQSQVKPEIDKQVITHYLTVSGIGKDLDDNEKDYFVTMATTYQLNPFKREIYCIPYTDYQDSKRTLSIVVGYNVYLKRAEKLQDLLGWRVWTEGQIKKVTKTVKRKKKNGDSYDKEVSTWEGNLTAHIEIKRKGKDPFIHSVEFNEYNQENKFWNDKPITMIKKVVTSQGFRLSYPADMGSLPYIQEEMPDRLENPPSGQDEKDNASLVSAEDQAMIDKLNSLPDKCRDGQYILDGLRNSGYRIKAATAFCNKHEWDNDKMKKALDEIANQ